jgi:hypothetical protein
LDNDRFEYQWASDAAFDGIRSEVFSDEGEIYWDVGLPDEGTATAGLIVAAVEFAQVSAGREPPSGASHARADPHAEAARFVGRRLRASQYELRV